MTKTIAPVANMKPRMRTIPRISIEAFALRPSASARGARRTLSSRLDGARRLSGRSAALSLAAADPAPKSNPAARSGVRLDLGESMIDASRAGSRMPMARRARRAQALMRGGARLWAATGRARVARWKRLPASRRRKEGVDGVDHGPRRSSRAIPAEFKDCDVLGFDEIAEFDEDRGKFRRLQDDEAGRAFRVVVELRCAAQIVDKTAREDVGVESGLSPFEVEQDVGDARIVKPPAPARPSSAAFSRAAIRAASASEARSATV